MNSKICVCVSKGLHRLRRVASIGKEFLKKFTNLEGMFELACMSTEIHRRRREFSVRREFVKDLLDFGGTFELGLIS